MHESRIRAVKDRLRIEDEIRRRGVDLRRIAESGSRLEGLCPFHDDHRPSFSVYVETQRFHCFGCGVDGDVLDFICAYDGRTLSAALEFLEAERVLAPAKEQAHTRRVVSQTHQVHEEPRVVQDHTPILTKASSVYHTCLLRTPSAMRYLQTRGITAKGIRLCGLGYTDGQALRQELAGNAHWSRAAQQAGLLTASGREWLSGRIIIPDLSREGNCSWMIGRMVPTTPHWAFRAEHKYLGLTIPKTLLGYQSGLALLEERYDSLQGLLLLEGALDYVVACEWDLPIVPLALLGTYASRSQLAALQRLQEKSGLPVIDWHDADEQGRTASFHLLTQLNGRPTLLFPEIAGVNDLGELGARPDGYVWLVRAWHSIGDGGEW